MSNIIRIIGIACLLGASSRAAEPETRQEARNLRLTLQEAVRLALQRSPEVAVAEAQASKAGELLQESRAARMPQVVTGTGLAYNNGFPLSIEGAAPSAFQIGLSQPLFSRRINNLVREAEQGVKAGRDQAEAARNEIAARTALAYSDLHQAGKLEAIWTTRVESAEREEKRLQDLLAAGRVRPLDLTKGQAATAGARHQLMVSREQSAVAEAELRSLIGTHDVSPIVTSEPETASDLIGLPAGALFEKSVATHPEILQAEANLRAKEFHVEAEKGGRYPRFDLVSQYALFTRFNNYQDYFNRFARNNYIIGMSIQVPLFDGFLTRAKVAQSRQDVTEAKLKLEQLRSGLRLGLERAASALRVARSASDWAARERDLFMENLRVSQALLEGGRLNPGEMSALEAQVQEKEINLIEARRNLFQKQVDVLRIAGALPNAF